MIAGFVYDVVNTMTDELEFTQLRSEDVERIGEVDRTERIDAKYRAASVEGGRSLILKAAPVEPPRLYTWTPQGILTRVLSWKPEVLQGGAMFGAVERERLAGFAIVSQRRQDETCELVALFVDAALRGTGMGSRLFAMAEEAAYDRDARALFIASNPTVATVDFYLNRGARVVGMQERSLVGGLNDGIQMAKPLVR